MNPDDAQKLLVAALSAFLSALAVVLVQRATTIQTIVKSDVSKNADKLSDGQIAEAAIKAVTENAHLIYKLANDRDLESQEIRQLRESIEQLKRDLKILQEKLKVQEDAKSQF